MRARSTDSGRILSMVVALALCPVAVLAQTGGEKRVGPAEPGLVGRPTLRGLPGPVIRLRSDTCSADMLQMPLTGEGGGLAWSNLAPRAAFFKIQQQPEAQQRGWIQRHPVLFGTMVGFGAGFLIGYVPGRDGTCPDFDASECGWMVGGVGAGVGAIGGLVVSLVTR